MTVAGMDAVRHKLSVVLLSYRLPSSLARLTASQGLRILEDGAVRPDWNADQARGGLVLQMQKRIKRCIQDRQIMKIVERLEY